MAALRTRTTIETPMELGGCITFVCANTIRLRLRMDIFATERYRSELYAKFQQDLLPTGVAILWVMTTIETRIELDRYTTLVYAYTVKPRLKGGYTCH